MLSIPRKSHLPAYAVWVRPGRWFHSHVCFHPQQAAYKMESLEARHSMGKKYFRPYKVTLGKAQSHLSRKDDFLVAARGEIASHKEISQH